MAKHQRGWVFEPPKSTKPKLSEAFKREVEERATSFVDTVLKPDHIKTPEPGVDLNYLIDIYTKWNRGYFYFCGKYCSPGPHAIAPHFDMNFARLTYTGDQHFSLAYLRHTGKWGDIFYGLTLDECLAIIRDDQGFHP